MVTTTRASAPWTRRFELRRHHALAVAHLPHVAVGRVAQQKAHALVARRAHPRLVEARAVGGVRVDAEVAAVHDGPDRGAQDEAEGVGDGVGHPVGLDLDGADGEAPAGLDRSRVRLEVRVLLEPVLDEGEGVGRAVDRHGGLAEHVGDRADVIFVAMREHDGAQGITALEQVREVRVDDVDAEIALGEHDAAVDHEQVAVLLDREAVHADLAETAERHEAKGRRGARRWGLPGRPRARHASPSQWGRAAGPAPT